MYSNLDELDRAELSYERDCTEALLRGEDHYLERHLRAELLAYYEMVNQAIAERDAQRPLF
jgi:hypothetical protein